MALYRKLGLPECGPVTSKDGGTREDCCGRH
jgi:hypothetical protein